MIQTIELMTRPIVDILVAVAARGGGENCINMLGKYLSQKDFHVRVVQMIYEGTDWADKSMDFHYCYPTREDHELKDFIEAYASFLKENGAPNLVLATAWPMMSYVAKRAAIQVGCDITVASWLHAPLKMYDQSGFGGGDYVKYADLHFAISNEIANEIRSFDPDGFIYRINNPADLSKTHNIEQSIPGTLLFVGRLSEEKNIGIIFGALAFAKTDWRLKLVGDGEEKSKLQELAKEIRVEDKIEFVGWSDDPWKYADNCYGLVLSSMYEGSPLVAIEAMSCGLPVIANVSSRVNEIIKPGKNGFLYEDNDAKGLAKILDMAAEGKFQSIDAAYCRECVADYDADTALFDFYIKLYATINKRTLRQYAWNQTESYIVKDKIDVIVPCYNVGKYVARCLDSIIGQTIGLSRINIIAINDASSDDTLEILNRYERNYSDNICIIDCADNLGPGGTRNLGLEYVSGQYIAFVDSDDCMAKDMLEKMYLLSKCYPSDVVTCDFETFDSDPPTGACKEHLESEITVIESELDRRRLFAENSIIHPVWGKLYRTEFILENKEIRFPEDLRMEDLYFSYIAVAYARVWNHIPEKYYFYYQNQDGIMKSSNNRFYYMDIHKVFELVISKYRQVGIFETVRRELEYAYYKKGFKDILMYMTYTFNEMPADNVKKLVDFMITNFPDITENKYLTEEERNQLKYLLGISGE